MGKMPPAAIAAMVGAILFFVVFAIFMARRTMKKVGTVKQELASGLERLGLRSIDTGNRAISRAEGVYRGRQVAMDTDGTAIMQKGNQAFTNAMAATFLKGRIAEMANEKSQEAAASMGDAAMKLRWTVALPLSSPVRVQIGKQAFEGSTPIGSDLHAQFDPMAQAALANPQVTAALAAADFDAVTIADREVVCHWVPSLAEYQAKIGGNTHGIVKVSEKALTALSTLCDGLYGRAG